MYCNNCGKLLEEGRNFCPECGKPVNTGNVTENKKEKVPKKTGKKVLIGIIAVVAVAVVAALGIFFIGIITRGSSKDLLIYLKDNELAYYNKKDSVVFSDDVYEDSDEIYGPYNEENINWVYVTKDGKYVFYPQNLSWGNFDLYYRKVNDAKSTENKVASDVAYYTLLQNNKVVYRENSGSNKMYITDLKDKEKIASDVYWFKVSDDEKYVLWQTDDEDKLYVCDLALKNDKIKIDSDISSLIYISDDLKEIVYTKDDALYCVKNFEEKEKIDSHVADDINIVQNDSQIEIYYMVDEEDIALSDFVEDDYASQDANMQEPDISDYQRTVTVNNFWGTSERVVTDDAYYTELDKYNDKLIRDYFREYLDEQIVANSYTMCRYIVGEKTAEECTTGIILYCNASYTPVLVYSELVPENGEKTKLSEVMEMDYTDDEIWENAQKGAIKTYMVHNGEKVELDIDMSDYAYNLYLGAVDEKNKECYFQVWESYDGYNVDLFKTSYSKMDGKMELITDELRMIELDTDEGVYYSVQTEDEDTYDLYLNGQLIDTDIMCGSVQALENGKGIVYMTDPDEYYEEGTLRMRTGSDIVKIADDVAYCVLNNNGDIAFLEEYDFDKYMGDLKVFRNGKVIKIDSDVTTVFYD